MGSSGRHQDLREGGTLSCGHGLGVIPTPWPRKAPPLPSPPPGSQGSQRPKSLPHPPSSRAMSQQGPAQA